MIIVNDKQRMADMPVDNRISMQVDLGVIRKTNGVIRFIIDPFLSEIDGDDALISVVENVQTNGRALVTCIDATKDDDIQDHATTDKLDECNDSLSTMIHAYIVCCSSCKDLIEYIKTDVKMDDITKSTYIDSCSTLNQALVLIGSHIMNLTMGQRYNPVSIHEVENAYRMVNPCSSVSLDESLEDKPAETPTKRRDYKPGWGN